MTTQSINLNVIPGGVLPRINVSQYDKGLEQIVATLYEGSSAFEMPSSATVYVQGTKKDGTGFQYSCSYSNNVVTIDLTDQMTVFAGEVVTELVIFDSSNNRIATCNFIINVEKTALSDDTQVSETDLPILQQIPEYAELAHQWATYGDDTDTPSPTNNAKYYCEQAAHIADLDASAVSFTPTAYLSSTNVQSAIEELDAETFRSRELCTETDANTIINPGIYWCNPSVTANLPDTAWGMLEVVTTSKSNHAYPLTQKYVVVGELGNKYYYRTYRYVAPNYVWSDWQTYESANEMYEYNGIMGAKNLLTFPYRSETTTVNGITYTVNDDDATITVNGTATAESTFTVAGNRNYDGNETKWNKIVETSSGKFRLTGCPSGGSANTYYLQCSGGIEGHTSWWGGGMDTGDGLTFSANIDGNKFYIYVCRIVIKEGVVCNNLVFKPMLRDANDVDETFRPYAKTNKELTDELDNLSASDVSYDNATSGLEATKTQGAIDELNVRLTELNTNLSDRFYYNGTKYEKSLKIITNSVVCNNADHATYTFDPFPNGVLFAIPYCGQGGFGSVSTVSVVSLTNGSIKVSQINGTSATMSVGFAIFGY